MSNRTVKRQAHPKLVPPRHRIKNVTLFDQKWGGGQSRAKNLFIENDNGAERNARSYSYHPTKGWRSRAL